MKLRSGRIGTGGILFPAPACVLSFFLVSLFLLPGCSSYRLGKAGVDVPFRNLHIAPVVVNIPVPELQNELERALRSTVIESGVVDLQRDVKRADAILEVCIESEKKETVAALAGDTGVADVMSREWQISFSLTDRTGRILISDSALPTRSLVFRDGGFAESYRQNIPAMADQLANDILDSILATC